MAPKFLVFRFPKRTSFDDLVECEEATPEVGRHDVPIKIRAVALNSRDLQVATGQYPFPVTDNLIPCSDGAGDIVAVGEGVGNLTQGDRVAISFNTRYFYGAQKSWLTCQGGYIDGPLAEYVVRPAASVVKVPTSARQSYAELASLVCAGVTAWNGLFGNVPPKPGQNVLVQGTGGVALTALAIAKAAGATTIVTSSSDAKLAAVKAKYSPDHCINYTEYPAYPAWADRALELVGEQGIDHIIKIGGVGTIEQTLRAIAYGGVISVIGYLAQYDAAKMPNVPLLALGKAAVVRGILIGPKYMLEDLVTFVDRVRLQLPVEKVFRFTREEVVAAYKELALGEGIGKICITLS
ncbi:zinc-dependent alcohol dehydrogenase family protein [Aspergillus brunneoviolaceus CBS 621.78]|uniref:NAD(P)-binding protein n=1 Tax=Aspergillus brunneoviolaceus CBS 621.78 TaxID=1450534 RepID=A0ACD1GHH7_9EURO|nr:NAD(P)-binding protein [Aspergillus brunneoviolaceus CBS 621.78]RAH48779.1 NAD(P)-binding protein [Aspergillus brunneoviolaceus CBS 621.78]